MIGYTLFIRVFTDLAPGVRFGENRLLKIVSNHAMPTSLFIVFQALIARYETLARLESPIQNGRQKCIFLSQMATKIGSGKK